MPYKTEHAARIKNPVDGARYWSKQLDNSMRIILMDGNVQAIRFKADYWTPAQAKTYLKKAGWKVIKFEPAIGENPMELQTGQITELGMTIAEQLMNCYIEILNAKKIIGTTSNKTVDEGMTKYLSYEDFAELENTIIEDLKYKMAQGY